MFLGSSGFGAFGVTYRPRCLWDNGGSVVVVRSFRADVRSMCSFVHANVTLGSTVVLPAKGSTRLQSCVLHLRAVLQHVSHVYRRRCVHMGQVERFQRRTPVEKDVSRAISAFQCRVSGVIQLLVSFFFFNNTII